jgi:pyruvate-formate lyase
MLTGHGKIRSYLYRFGLRDNALCLCEEEEQQQTVDHLIFKCKKLSKNRNEMIKQIKNNGGNWLTSNETLVNNYLQFFVTFVKSIDFTDLQ